MILPAVSCEVIRLSASTTRYETGALRPFEVVTVVGGGAGGAVVGVATGVVAAAGASVLVVCALRTLAVGTARRNSSCRLAGISSHAMAAYRRPCCDATAFPGAICSE